jgi:hypothetical protein
MHFLFNSWDKVKDFAWMNLAFYPIGLTLKKTIGPKLKKMGERKALISITTFKGGNMCCRRRVRIARKARSST